MTVAGDQAQAPELRPEVADSPGGRPANKADAPRQEGESGQAAQLERVREILFGKQARHLESNLGQLRNQVVVHLAKLERDTEARMEQLRGEFLGRTRELTERSASDEATRRTAHAEQVKVAEELRTALAIQTQHLARLTQQLSTYQAEASQRLAQVTAEFTRRLSGEIQQREQLHRTLLELAARTAGIVERLNATEARVEERITGLVQAFHQRIHDGELAWGERLAQLNEEVVEGLHALADTKADRVTLARLLRQLAGAVDLPAASGPETP